MSTSLKKGLMYVLIANFINLGFNLITNFVLPKELSVESYATIKTFQLYVSYAGLFHFGFVDGMYLKYGGKNIKELRREDLGTNLSTLRLFEIAVTIVCAIIAIISKQEVLVFFSLSILPLNLANYFKQLYQATGEFSLYGKIMNANTILIFFANMIWIFLIKTDNALCFLLSNVAVYFIVWIVLELNCKKLIGSKNDENTFSFDELIKNIKAGILLTVGNLSSVVLTSMDRWFVKALMTTLAFAQYSFAVSMENFMNVAVTPVTTTLYNYFCKATDEVKVRKARNYVMIFAALIVSCAFPARFILEVYLTKYIDSAKVMFLLFAAQIFYIVIKSIYVNLYFSTKTADFQTRIQKEIEKKITELQSDLLPDNVNNAIESSFQIGKEYSFSKMMEIAREGSFRYSEEIPPGYEDGKEKTGLQKYGDLFVWNQILDCAKSKQKDFIFVTNDVKIDWYEEDKRTPRFELLKEFREQANKRIWLLSMKNFIYHVNLLLDDQIHENVLQDIDSVQDEKENDKIRKELSADDIQKIFNNLIVKPIYVIDKIPKNESIRLFDNPDIYEAEDENGRKFRIITTIVGGGNYARVLHGMTNAFELKKLYETGNEHYWYYNFIIAKNEALVEKIMEHMGKTKVRKLFADHSIQTAVCYLNEDQNINIAKANFDI